MGPGGVLEYWEEALDPALPGSAVDNEATLRNHSTPSA